MSHTASSRDTGSSSGLRRLVGKVTFPFLLTPQLAPQFVMSQTSSTVVAVALVVVIVVAVPVHAVTVVQDVDVLVETVSED